MLTPRKCREEYQTRTSCKLQSCLKQTEILILNNFNGKYSKLDIDSMYGNGIPINRNFRRMLFKQLEEQGWHIERGKLLFFNWYLYPKEEKSIELKKHVNLLKISIIGTLIGIISYQNIPFLRETITKILDIIIRIF